MTGKALSTILELYCIRALKDKQKIAQDLLEWLFIVCLVAPDYEFAHIGVQWPSENCNEGAQLMQSTLQHPNTRNFLFDLLYSFEWLWAVVNFIQDKPVVEWRNFLIWCHQRAEDFYVELISCQDIHIGTVLPFLVMHY